MMDLGSGGVNQVLDQGSCRPVRLSRARISFLSGPPASGFPFSAVHRRPCSWLAWVMAASRLYRRPVSRRQAGIAGWSGPPAVPAARRPDRLPDGTC